MLAVLIGLLLILTIELFLALFGVVPLKDRDPFVGFTGSSPAIIPKPDQPGTFILNPAKKKNFNNQEFTQPKPPNTFRLISFGGSTTYGRPYINDTSFPNWTQKILNQGQNSTRFENINMGGISYASYRVGRLVEEMSTYSPDLYIIYSGHNEFLESRTFEKIISEPIPMRRLRSILHRSRVYTVISDLIPSIKGKKKLGLSEDIDAKLEQIGGYELYHRDNDFREGVIAQYRSSMKRIIEFSIGKKIPVILCTIPSNLTGTSPFKSEHREDLSPEELAEWKDDFFAAQDSFYSHNYERALEFIRSAEKTDNSFAYLHYLKGHILLELGRPVEAREALIRAKEEDIVPLRSLEKFNTIIRELAGTYNVPLADVEYTFREAAPNGLPGNELFVDHVHPTIKGQQLIAWTIVDAAAKSGILPFDPFPDQASRENLLAYLQNEYDRITPRYRAMGYWGIGRLFHWAGKYQEARSALLKAWKTVKDVAEIPYLLGDIELVRGDPQIALFFFQQARETGGEETRVAYGMAKAAIKLNDGEKALRILDGIPASRRKNTRHLALSGEAYLLVGRIDDSIRNLEEAVLKTPDVKRFLLPLARAYIIAGKESLAKDIFQRYAELSDTAPNEYSEFRSRTLDTIPKRKGMK